MTSDSELLQFCYDFLQDYPLGDFSLEVEAGQVFLLDGQGRELSIDFDGNQADYQRKNQKGGQDLLIKAITGDKKIERVLDLSAGLGIDAIYLSQYGFEVTSLERNPVLYLLLSKALEKTAREDLKDLRFVYSDSATFLKSLTEHMYQVAYFDPMYPEKKKSALPRKEMQVFRQLVGDDEDSEEVLRNALEKDFQRVIVKRPLKAAPLLPGVVHSFKGKTVRYDLYVPRP